MKSMAMFSFYTNDHIKMQLIDDENDRMNFVFTTKFQSN